VLHNSILGPWSFLWGG